MKKNHSIINWEVYKKVKKPNMKISKKIYRYKKPFLGRMLDKIVNYWSKIKKKPLNDKKDILQQLSSKKW